MWKLYEIFKVLKVQKRIVSAESIRGNTVVLKLRVPYISFDRQRTISRNLVVVV